MQGLGSPAGPPRGIVAAWRLEKCKKTQKVEGWAKLTALVLQSQLSPRQAARAKDAIMWSAVCCVTLVQYSSHAEREISSLSVFCARSLPFPFLPFPCPCFVEHVFCQPKTTVQDNGNPPPHTQKNSSFEKTKRMKLVGGRTEKPCFKCN